MEKIFTATIYKAVIRENYIKYISRQSKGVKQLINQFDKNAQQYFDYVAQWFHDEPVEVEFSDSPHESVNIVISRKPGFEKMSDVQAELIIDRINIFLWPYSRWMQETQRKDTP